MKKSASIDFKQLEDNGKKSLMLALQCLAVNCFSPNTHM